MTLANIYLDSNSETQNKMLENANKSYQCGDDYTIEIYTFIDGSSIGYLGEFDADLLESILNEIK